MAKSSNHIPRWMFDEMVQTGYERHTQDKARRKAKAPRKNNRKHGKFAGQAYIGNRTRLENKPETFARFSIK